MTTLRQRLTLTHTLVALLAVLLVALLASGLIVRAYGQLIRQQAAVTRQNLRTALANYYLRTDSWDRIEQVLQERLAAQPLPAIRRVVLADQDGRVLFDSFNLLTGRRLTPRLRQQSEPIQVRGQTVGYVAVPIGFESQSDAERGFIRSISSMVLIGSGVAGGVAMLVALLVARRVTQPLRSLTLAARRLAAGERHQPLEAPSEAELAELSHAFNSMAAELARQEDLRRQLVADIAHELRTPLSVLRLQVDGLEDGVAQPTPETLASLREEVDLLARLVEDLRLLSLAEAGHLALAIESLDIYAALERAAATAAPRARQQGINLRVERHGPLPDILADPQRLAQVLGNLLENALRYTPPGGQVTLRALPGNQQLTLGAQRALASNQAASASHQSLTIEVSDTGPGIAAENLPHVFDRFYRIDRARARDTGGSGLGLAIVQRLVEAQAGQVGVHSDPGTGTTFRVILPAAPAARVTPAMRSMKRET